MTLLSTTTTQYFTTATLRHYFMLWHNALWLYNIAFYYSNITTPFDAFVRCVLTLQHNIITSVACCIVLYSCYIITWCIEISNCFTFSYFIVLQYQIVSKFYFVLQCFEFLYAEIKSFIWFLVSSVKFSRRFANTCQFWRLNLLLNVLVLSNYVQPSTLFYLFHILTKIAHSCCHH